MFRTLEINMGNIEFVPLAPYLNTDIGESDFKTRPVSRADIIRFGVDAFGTMYKAGNLVIRADYHHP